MANASPPALPAASPDDGPHFREPWDVDEVAVFLHPPTRLAELLETADLPLHARIAVYVDARGAIARVELDGVADEDLSAAMRDALHDASFLPARSGGAPVPSVKRFEVGSAMLAQRVVRADTPDDSCPEPAQEKGPPCTGGPSQ